MVGCGNEVGRIYTVPKIARGPNLHAIPHQATGGEKRLLAALHAVVHALREYDAHALEQLFRVLRHDAPEDPEIALQLQVLSKRFRRSCTHAFPYEHLEGYADSKLLALKKPGSQRLAAVTLLKLFRAMPE